MRPLGGIGPSCSTWSSRDASILVAGEAGAGGSDGGEGSCSVDIVSVRGGSMRASAARAVPSLPARDRRSYSLRRSNVDCVPLRPRPRARLPPRLRKAPLPVPSLLICCPRPICPSPREPLLSCPVSTIGVICAFPSSPAPVPIPALDMLCEPSSYARARDRLLLLDLQ